MSDFSRIMIVDDELQNIKVMNQVLKNEFIVMAAKSGAQVLKGLQVLKSDEMPELILLDIVMPGMDGYEVCRRLKSNAATKHIPVIFLTAVPESEDASWGFQCGAVDYVNKPFNPLMVKARIELHIKLYRTMRDLKNALQQVEQLSGLLPICMHCKKIRDDRGYWNQIEAYLADHSEARFSHSICQECLEKYYPDFNFEDDDEES